MRLEYNHVKFWCNFVLKQVKRFQQTQVEQHPLNIKQTKSIY